MTTSSSSAAKKPKMASENDDFESVKRYLLECPHVASDHPAITAAVQGIEKEQQRRERDAKLQRKFAQQMAMTSTNAAGAATATAASNTTYSNNNLEDSVVVVDAAPASATPPNHNKGLLGGGEDDDDQDEMMEWQDVAEKKDDGTDDGTTSFLGQQLTKISIDSISEHQVKVKSPVAAIAVVLHATLRSQLLDFSCTGIPEDTSATAKKGGFAVPVRELPRSQFLPFQWDAKPDQVALRYRKNGTGAMILTVQREADGTIAVRLQPASNKEPSSQALSFALDDHVNLDSWNAALKVASNIPPSLHYKFLSVLLTNFCRTFDLGSVNDDGTAVAAEAAAPYVDNTVPIQMATMQPIIHKSDFVPPQPIPVLAGGHRNRPSWNEGIPTTLDQAFPGTGRRLNPGDFHRDLAPAGLIDPRFAEPSGINDGHMGGNLMGPNHPMFMGGGSGMQGPPMGGPGSMQPRFDPIYPPGVDPRMDPNHPQRRNRRTPGEPNPDHLPPPNSFGNDMFS